MIKKSEKMIRNHGGPTVADLGYRAAFNAVTTCDATIDETSIGDDSTGTIIASVTKYAKHAISVLLRPTSCTVVASNFGKKLLVYQLQEGKRADHRR